MTPPIENSVTPRVALVGCGDAKRDESFPAKELYSSGYFTLKRQYSEQHCDDWQILSAKYGLLNPEREIDPYDASLSPRSDSYIGDKQAEEWGSRTRDELHEFLTGFTAPGTVVVLAGEDYGSRVESKLEQTEWSVEWRFRQEDLRGIGKQMQWLSEQTDG